MIRFLTVILLLAAFCTDLLWEPVKHQPVPHYIWYTQIAAIALFFLSFIIRPRE